MKKSVIPFLIFILVFFYQYGLIPFPPADPGSVRMIAHRGDSRHTPENTLPAFESAIQNNAECIEMDIRCTRDGVPVIFHDASLYRLTGKKKRLSDISCRDFLSSPLISSGSAENCPRVTPCTLEQALIFCGNTPGLCLHLELKVRGIEEKVVSLIRKYDSVCSYEISSSDPVVLQNIRHLAPDIETFLLLSSASDVCEYLAKNPEGIDGISVKSVYITAFLTTCVHNRNQKIYAWTVNHPLQMRRLCRLRVNGIITDNPPLFQKTLS